MQVGLGEMPALSDGKCVNPRGGGRGTEFRLRLCRSMAGLPSPTPLPERLCCNGSRFPVASMGVALYLALVGGGLTAAFLATVVLKGVRLI